MAQMPPSDRAARRVFNGLLNLNDSQAQEVIDAYERYRRLPFSERRLVLEKSAPRVTLGPVSSVCPCCGS